MKKEAVIELFGQKVSILLCTVGKGINVILHFLNETEATRSEIKSAFIQYICALETIAISQFIQKI